MSTPPLLRESSVPPSSRSRRGLGYHLLPLLVAALVLGMALIALVRVLDLERAADRARFRIETRTVMDTVSSRVRYQERLLDAVAGLYAVVPAERLPPRVWYRFVRDLEPLRFSPGLVAVMHIRPPAGKRASRCLVDRFWPEGVAARVLGVDACHNARILPALLQASADGTIRASRPLPVWNLHEKPTLGFALVKSLPDVSGSRPPTGWVMVVLSLPRLVRHVSGDRHLAVALAPADWKTGYIEEGAARPRTHTGWLSFRARVVRRFSVGGETWHVTFARIYHAGMLPRILLGGGLAVALLAYFITHLSLRTRDKATELAERLTERLKRNFELLRSIMNNVTEGIYRSTPDGGVLFCNRAMAQLFGYPSVHDLLHVDPERLYVHPERRRELLDLLVREQSYERLEVEMVRRNGERFVVLESARATFEPDGRIRHIDGVITDVTTLRQAESRAAYLDQYDKHTGLPNRTLIRDRIHQALESARARPQRVVVIDFDLDRFVAVNDLHGQDTGDDLLEDLGRRLQAIAEAPVSVGRLGEDEFVGLTTIPAEGYSEILLLVSRFQKAVAEAYHQHAPDVGGTAAVGVSLLPGDARTEEELVLHAGAALRAAKERAPGSVVFYSPETHQTALNETRLVHRLQDLVAAERFAVAFQPIVDVGTRRVVSLEALARWPHDDLPLVTPDVFVPLAERHRLIGRIEDTVWSQAFATWLGWAGEPWRPSSLSINVSLRHLMEEGFDERFLGLLAGSRMPPEDVVVELTETNLLERPEELQRILRRFTAQGVRVAVDDFGTGYSGLSLLRRLPVSILKVDRSCVDNVADDPNARVIARAVAGLARDLSLELVAEGVERAVDRDVLVGFGYRRFQGFLYAPPLDAVDVPNFAASFAVQDDT